MGRFQEEKMRTRPRGSGTNSADESSAIAGSFAYQLSSNQQMIPCKKEIEINLINSLLVSNQ